MTARMNLKEAANVLGVKESSLKKQIDLKDLSYCQNKNNISFGHTTAKKLFNFKFQSQILVFQIVKGGTGKTSLAHELAVRANMYGAKVLCIDLDQQGNLTHSFNKTVDEIPIMVDILAENYSIAECLVPIGPGIDLLGSRIENASLNEVIRLKKLPLDVVYKDLITRFKKHYDLIIIDCPPNLDRSVAAAAIASDRVIAPAVPERFALEGLRMTCESLTELQHVYGCKIPFSIVLNKLDKRTILAQETIESLKRSKLYRGNLLNTYVRISQEFPNAIARGGSIFDLSKQSIAKTDIDQFTREILNIEKLVKLKNTLAKKKSYA